MRQIKSDGLDTKEWEDWISDCADETRNIITLFEKGEKIEFSVLYKRKYIKENYFFTDQGPFFGKCVYCETPMLDIFPGDVEHYRPKGKVTDEKGNVIFKKKNDGTFILDDDGNKILHPGYYWLAYEWTNLMPSCAYCNRPKKDFGKRSCFPVKGFNIFKVGDEKLEEPLLINPIDEKEDIETHMSVDFDTGLLIPKTTKGKMTIELLGLNKRDFIIGGRLKAINDCRIQLTKLMYSSQKQEALDEIQAYKNGNRSYSFAFMMFFNYYMDLKGLLN